MAQNKLFDPELTSGPTLVGVGNGSLAVDRLTHFTIAQTYTATCIAKTPDTLFSISGSVDGPVGIATVGTQFFDEDLKVFLTIQQGSTAFEVGDQFTFVVVNGTDLNQDNIDDYDELPQKNYGLGTKGTLSGDHNTRFDDDAQFAQLILQDLRFIAVASGNAGNSIQVEYLNPTPSTYADLEEQDLTFEARQIGTDGNDISIEYEDFTPAVGAQVEIQDLTFYAQTPGAAGNGITIEYTTGGTAGSEVVTVVGLAISVQIDSGASTAQNIKDAIDGDMDASALVGVTISGTASNPQTGPVSATNLEDGADAIGLAGFEVVTVVGDAITIKFEAGVSTAQQIKDAVEADFDANALVAVIISGTASDPQTAPFGPSNLAGGTDGVGTSGFEDVNVTGNLIQVYLDPGVSSAQAIYDLLTGDAGVTALVGISIVGDSANPQFGPIAATNLSGGKNQRFTFNHHEITDSGSFIEGNASVKVNDIEAIGGASFAKHVKAASTLGLNNSASGRSINDAQRFMNRLRSLGKMLLQTAAGDKVAWASNALTLGSDLLFYFKEGTVVNTLPENTFMLDDGESIFVHLNPDTTQEVSYEIGANASSVTAFRLGTRVGTAFVWFNNIVLKANESVLVGGAVDLHDQVFMVIAGGGLLTHSGVTPGLITWPSNITVQSLGTSVILTILASNTTLADGEVGYINLPDPLASGNVTIQKAAIATGTLSRPDRFWLFYRQGTRVYFRNGTSIDQSETARIQTVGSSSANIANSIIRRDGNGDFAARIGTLTKLLVASGSGNGIDVQSAGDLEIGASVGANDVIIGGASSNVVIPGNLEVQGTQTILNTTTLEVEDTNITVNSGGTDMSAEGAGLTVDRTGTSGSLVYEDALASKWKAGALGSEIELANVSSVQTLLNKVLQILALGTSDDAATGANATLSTPTASQIRLTNGALVSIDMIPAPTTVEVLVVHNVTGNSILVNDETGGTAANRIRTGTGANFTVTNNASFILAYDLTSSRWRLLGGSSLLLAAVGSSPNANGATLSAGTLTLQPADGSFPGVMTAITQTFGGFKTFNSSVKLVADLFLNRSDNSAATGANATVTLPDQTHLTLNNASLTSIDGIAAPSDAKVLFVTNLTGNMVEINDNTGATAANRIRTGTGATFEFENNATIILVYNGNTQRWYMSGGGGGGGGSGVTRTITGSFGSPISITAGGGITTTVGVDEDIYLTTAGGEVNVTANPQLTAGTVDGQVLKLIGTSDTDYVLLETGTGLWLNGDWRSYANACLTLRWDSGQSLWVEVARNF